MAEQYRCARCGHVYIEPRMEAIDGYLFCYDCAWDYKHPVVSFEIDGEDILKDLPKRSPEELGLTGVEGTLAIGPDADIHWGILPPAISWLARMRLKHYREYLARTDD